MTVRNRWFTMDNKAGVDLNTPVSVSATLQPELPAAPHNLGDRVQGNGGSEWMYVQASATVSAFNAIAIDSSAKAKNVTTAIHASGVYTYGIAHFQTYGGASVGTAPGGVADAGQFFWALVKANQGAKVNLLSSASAPPGSGLYVSGEPGRLTVTGSGGRFVGIQVVASASGTAVEVVMPSYMLPSVLIVASASASA